VSRNNDEDYAPHISPTIYYDRTHDIEAAKILPGEYYVTQRDMVIVTVLGSCISACIRDRVTGAGGMNHFMLPGNDSFSDEISQSARYGAFAMEILINKLMGLGAMRRNLEAKVFGGGLVLRGFTTTTVGERNAEFVMHYLKTENIQVVASDLLDIYPRKVYYFPKTGRALVKKLRSVHNNTIVEREREYEHRLSSTHIEGAVELF
jgi:chemotaxis protein CheD